MREIEVDLGSEVFVHYIELPGKVYSLCCQNEDDTYSIFIDPRLSEERRLKCYWHEVEHIKHGDFSSALPATRIELVRH